MRTELVAAAALTVSACAPNPTVLGPDSFYPEAPREAMRGCPDGNPETDDAILPPAEDGTRGAMLDARARTAELYSECRDRHEALIEHERDRQEWIDERAEE